MSVHVNIIGAGLAGLSTGIFLEQKGIKTEIFEMAPWAGGMCTAWTRSGYRFDGCIHWMVGTRKGDPIYELYLESGALDAATKIYNAPSIKTEINGTMHDIPLEADAFHQFLTRSGEDDEAAIQAMMKDIKAMMKAELMLGPPNSLGQVIRFLIKGRGFMSIARKHGRKTVEQYRSNIHSDTVKQLIYRLMPPHFSAMALIMMLGTRMGGNAGYPLGGAQEVTRRMVEKYCALGGKIHFNNKVDKIVVENGQSKGISVKGTYYPSDYVVAACDAHDTLVNMLGGKYAHPQLDAMLKDAPLFEPLALVSFGLNKRFDIPFAITYECPEGITTSTSHKAYALSLRSFDFDSGAAPGGASSIMAMFGAPQDYWVNLRALDLVEYKRQKQAMADDVANFLEKRIPGIKASIQVTDVSTPATYLRLTNVFKASYEGFEPVPRYLMNTIQKSLPGVSHLYLCGQWTTAGGGICTAIADGKIIAKKIAKDNRNAWKGETKGKNKG